ncbi:hypothetical protein TNCV_121901 [Trichonephila clavipes]|nr:hypothetical protein TNCV_121901 [Trichonephila clavipes]
MAVAPRQYISAHIVSDQQKYYCDGESTLFVPMRLFLYFLQRNLAEREPLSPQLKKLRQKGKSPKRTCKNLVLELLPTMATPNAEVCE